MFVYVYVVSAIYKSVCGVLICLHGMQDPKLPLKGLKWKDKIYLSKKHKASNG